MDKDNIYAVYNNLEDLRVDAADLENQEIDREDLFVLASQRSLDDYDGPYESIVYENTVEGPDNLVQRASDQVNQWFGGTPQDFGPYRSIKDEISRGKYALLVNRNLDRDGNVQYGALDDNEIGSYNNTIRLHQERAYVEKEIQEHERVNVSKKVIVDEQEVVIPVRREELHIERYQVDQEGREVEGSRHVDVVTLAYEEPVVYTDRIVVREANIEKSVNYSTEVLSSRVQHEELMVDDQGTGSNETIL